MAMYESEHTRFMREWLEKHPEELEEQKRGRAMWWDKPPCDPATQQQLAAVSVPQKPYYYDAN
jgi:hypothetical protein